MNLVRLGMIVALAVIAEYALSIYGALPPDMISTGPTTVTLSKKFTFNCPAVSTATQVREPSGWPWLRLAGY